MMIKSVPYRPPCLTYYFAGCHQFDRYIVGTPSVAPLMNSRMSLQKVSIGFARRRQLMSYRVGYKNILDISEDNGDGLRIQQRKHARVKHLRNIGTVPTNLTSNDLPQLSIGGL